MNKSSKTIILYLLFMAFTVYGAFLHSQELSQIDSKTNVSFKIKNMGVNVAGAFKEVNITGRFDKNNLSDSYFNATIEVVSINTNNRKRDHHLRSNDYFDAKKYPVITLNTNKITLKSGNNYQLNANLTIKNTTQKIDIPVEIITDNSNLTLIAKFKVNRLDYNVGKKKWIMANDAYVTVNYTAKR
ncbi:MAG: polyisoprenoid-binding protein [Flavobacteriales bacterium]|nr:MAG: polyisoprenoid-binding protein [Flavobacteriales bacterium]